MGNSPAFFHAGRKDRHEYTARVSTSFLSSRKPAETFLLPAVALLLPGITAHVVAVLLPEPGLVARYELKAADPLGALPEVQVRNEKTEWPAMLGRDLLAVARVHEHVLIALQIVQAEVRGEAVFGVDHHVGRFGFELNQLEDLSHGNAFPRAVQQRPAGDTVDVSLYLFTWQLLDVLVRKRDRCVDQAVDRERPSSDVDFGDAAVVQHRPLLGEVLTGWEAVGNGPLTLVELAPQEVEAHGGCKESSPYALDWCRIPWWHPWKRLRLTCSSSLSSAVASTRTLSSRFVPSLAKVAGRLAIRSRPNVS